VLIINTYILLNLTLMHELYSQTSKQNMSCPEYNPICYFNAEVLFDLYTIKITINIAHRVEH